MPFIPAAATWAMSAQGLAAIGLATTATSMATQASAQRQAGETEKKWQEYNAAITEREAESTKQAAVYEEKAHRKRGKRLLSRMLVEGYSPLMMTETAGELEKDAQMIRRGGVLGEQRLTSQAAIERGKGKFARRAGRWRAGATLLSGGTKMASQYGAYKGYW